MGHPKTQRQALALMLLGMVGLLGMPSSAWAAPAKSPGCLIEPEQTADVGTPVTGVIEELPVKLGDEVRAGQALVVLRADVEKANAQAAQLRSSVDAEARAAQASLVLAQQKVDRARQLLTQHFVSDQALEQAQAEADVARQKHRLALAQQQIYRQEQNVAKAQVGLRTLRSPISGIVVERYNNLGERVEERPVMRVASIDPLRVTLMVPMAQYGQVKVGDSLSIVPELPGQAPLQAQVQYVDKVVDAASNTFRVRLRLPNPDHKLPGGLRCKADIAARAALKPASAVPAAATPARRVATDTPLLLMASNSLSLARLSTRVASPTHVSKPVPVPVHVSMPGSMPVAAPVTQPVHAAGARPDAPFKLSTRLMPMQAGAHHAPLATLVAQQN